MKKPQFIPFKRPAPLGYEYQESLQPVKTVSDFIRDAKRDFYEELEGVVCCMMAAGVSADKIITTEPKAISDDGYNFRISCYIGCKP